jgi:opacity protein-like surface antigen
MNRSTLALGLFAGLTGLSGAAYAQTDWTGPYVGVGVGYSKDSGNSGERLLFDTGGGNGTVRTAAGADAFSPGFCDGAAIGRTPAEGCKDSDGNLDLSIRAGWDWQRGSWVFGGVIDASTAKIGEDVAGFSTTPASYTFTRDINSTIAARGRMGYAFDRYLAYGTAGVAWADIDHGFYTSNTANSFTPNDPDDSYGYQLGGGLEMKWSDNISIGVEYLYTNIEDDSYKVVVGRGTAPATNPFLLGSAGSTEIRRSESDFDFHTIKATMAWHF